MASWAELQAELERTLAKLAPMDDRDAAVTSSLSTTSPPTAPVHPPPPATITAAATTTTLPPTAPVPPPATPEEAPTNLESAMGSPLQLHVVPELAMPAPATCSTECQDVLSKQCEVASTCLASTYVLWQPPIPPRPPDPWNTSSGACLRYLPEVTRPCPVQAISFVLRQSCPVQASMCTNVSDLHQWDKISSGKLGVCSSLLSSTTSISASRVQLSHKCYITECISFQYSTLGLLELVNKIYVRLQEDVFEGIELQAKRDGSATPCKNLKILNSGDTKLYEVSWIRRDKSKTVVNTSVVKATDLVRRRAPVTRNTLKLLIRDATSHSTPWILHEHLAKKYGIPMEPPNNARKKFKKHEEHASVPITYPIDDLLVNPAADGPALLKRPPLVTDFGIPRNSVGDLLMVWDFCLSFGRVLNMYPLSLADLENAICHKESNVLIVEIHSALLHLLTGDAGDYFTALQSRRMLKLSLETWVIDWFPSQQNTSSWQQWQVHMMVSLAPRLSTVTHTFAAGVIRCAEFFSPHSMLSMIIQAAHSTTESILTDLSAAVAICESLLPQSSPNWVASCCDNSGGTLINSEMWIPMLSTQLGSLVICSLTIPWDPGTLQQIVRQASWPSSVIDFEKNISKWPSFMDSYLAMIAACLQCAEIMKPNASSSELLLARQYKLNGMHLCLMPKEESHSRAKVYVQLIGQSGEVSGDAGFFLLGARTWRMAAAHIHLLDYTLSRWNCLLEQEALVAKTEFWWFEYAIQRVFSEVRQFLHWVVYQQGADFMPAPEANNMNGLEFSVHNSEFNSLLSTRPCYHLHGSATAICPRAIPNTCHQQLMVMTFNVSWFIGYGFLQLGQLQVAMAGVLCLVHAYHFVNIQRKTWDPGGIYGPSFATSLGIGLKQVNYDKDLGDSSPYGVHQILLGTIYQQPLPWDTGGNFPSAWGQADFQAGEYVTHLVPECEQVEPDPV